MSAKSAATESAGTPQRYRVDDLLVDVGRRSVSRNDLVLDISGRTFDLLLALIRAAPNLVSIDQLMTEVWRSVVVNNEAVTQRVKTLRQALGDRPDQPRYVASVRGHGYRLLAPVVPLMKPDNCDAEIIRTPVTIDPQPAEPTSTRERFTQYSKLVPPVLALLVLIGLGTWWLHSKNEIQLPTIERDSIAVLPFVNMTGDTSKEYLADGMAEELINALSRVPGLKVPARTSSFAYKGRNINIRDIAKDLQVGTLLEGSVRTAGQRIRITVQLINAQDGLHLWSQTYDEEFADLFKLQDLLAAAVTTELRPNLTTAATTRQPHPTNDLEAYNFYLQGVSLVHRTSAENSALAINYFQQALQRDPKFARAYAMLAEAEMGWATSDSVNSTEHYIRAERAAHAALQLDPTLANPHTALAGIAANRRKIREMAEHSRAALSLAPDDAFVLVVAGDHFSIVGQLRAALDEATRAYALAPANPFVVSYLAYFHSVMGHDEEALRFARISQDLGFPKKSFPLTAVHTLSLIRHRRFSDAEQLINEAMDKNDAEEARDMQIVHSVMTILQNGTNSNTANPSISEVLHPVSDAPLHAWGACFDIAISYALVDAFDIAYSEANRCLDRAMPQSSHGNLPLTFLWWTPELRAFRSDSRFQALATHMGLIDYALQYGPPDDCELKAGNLSCH